MDSGSTTIADARIILLNATDIARFSFIVQDSVFYLDLEVRAESRFSDYFGALCICCKPKRFTNFVNTEENCRNFFAPRRRLLYALNLDLPKGRERSLKGHDDLNSSKRRRCCRRLHIAEIIPVRNFYARNLSDFITHAVRINVPKEKILKLITKIPFSELNLLSFIDISITSQFIDCFYPEVKDSDLFSGFIKQFDILDYMVEYEQPETLKFLLYHARLFGNKSLDDELDFDLITFCISEKCYLNIGPLLKYISDSRPTDIDCQAYLFELTLERSDLIENVKERAAEKSISRSRLCLLMQVIRAYVDSQQGLQEAASEALRLIWSSVPGAVATYGEFKVFEPLLCEKALEDVFDFYVKAVGELHEQAEPRSLQHLCMTVLRRTFEKNNLWIPDGISRIYLPKSLEAFLNLEPTIKPTKRKRSSDF